MKFIEKLENRLKKLYFKNNGDISIEKMSERTFECVNYCMKLVGYDIFNDDIKAFINVRFIFMMSLLVIIQISYVYSYYELSDDFQSFMFLTSTLNLLIQCLGKVYAFVLGRKNLTVMLDLCNELIEFAENTEMRKCFEKWLIRGFHVGALMMVNCTTVYIILSTSPILLYFLFDIKTMMLGIIVPFVDPESVQGYLIHYCFHSISSVIADLMFFTTFTIINDFLFHFLAFFESLEVLIDMLESVIKHEKSEEKDESIRKILTKLIEGHNLCYKFLTAFEKSYKLYHMIEVGGSMFGTAVGIFALKSVKITKKARFLDDY